MSAFFGPKQTVIRKTVDSRDETTVKGRFFPPNLFFFALKRNIRQS